MSTRFAIALTGLVAAAGLAAEAQEPKPKAEPDLLPTVRGAARDVARGARNANVVPGPFRAQLVVDNRFPLKGKAEPGKAASDEDRDPRDRTGKIHDLVGEFGLSPVVAVFVRADVKGADGLTKLLKGVDALLPKYRADKLGAFAMFLKLEGGTKAVTQTADDGSDAKVAIDLEYPHDEARAAKAEEVRAYAAAVGAPNVPFGLAAEKSTGLDAFSVGETTPVTVVIYNRLRVAQRWELKADEMTDERVAEILSAIEAMVKGRKP